MPAAPHNARVYALRDCVVLRKTRSSGNFWAARRACAGFRNIPNPAEPLPASEASAAPYLSNSRRIRPRRGYHGKTAGSKSFERPAPRRLQHRAQKHHSLDTVSCFVNRGPLFLDKDLAKAGPSREYASLVLTDMSCGDTT